jgi:hypothetical protein
MADSRHKIPFLLLSPWFTAPWLEIRQNEFYPGVCFRQQQRPFAPAFIMVVPELAQSSVSRTIGDFSHARSQFQENIPVFRMNLPV